MIDVEVAPTASGWDADVELNAGQADASRHHVRVKHSDMEHWGGGGTPEELVRRAFEFLLARERPDQILKSFDLADIARHFPDFPETMSR